MNRWFRVALRGLVVTALAAGGCGYTQSGGVDADHSLYRRDVRTIAVPIFTNRSYVQGVEFALTKAVINQIEATTPYKVADQRTADTILEGHITHVSAAPISTHSETALPQEEMITISVDFVWKNLHTGQILTQHRNFQQMAAYYPTLGEGAYIGKQSNVEKLALAIVQELQADW